VVSRRVFHVTTSSVDSSLTVTFHCDPGLSRTEQADEFIAGKCVDALGGKTAPGATDGNWTDAARLLVERNQPATEIYVPEIIVTQTNQKHIDKRNSRCQRLRTVPAPKGVVAESRQNRPLNQQETI
jgi:hypothetical protein